MSSDDVHQMRQIHAGERFSISGQAAHARHENAPHTEKKRILARARAFFKLVAEAECDWYIRDAVKFTARDVQLGTLCELMQAVCEDKNLSSQTSELELLYTQYRLLSPSEKDEVCRKAAEKFTGLVLSADEELALNRKREFADKLREEERRYLSQ